MGVLFSIRIRQAASEATGRSPRTKAGSIPATGSILFYQGSRRQAGGLFFNLNNMSVSIKKVRELNGQKFIDDFRSVHTVMASTSGYYFRILKREVMEHAENSKVHYCMTDKIFKKKRIVMVIY